MMFNYIEEVNKNIKIEEGKNVIENILINIYFKEGISTKELGRNMLLPIPIVAAIKKEFIKRKILIQDRGIRLTSEGKAFIEDELGFKNINKNLYIKLLTDPWKDHKEIIEIREELNIIFKNRPQVDVTIDQSKCSIDTAIKRAVLCIKNHTLIGKKILCIGDDDLVSIAIGFLLRKLYKTSIKYKTSITVMDIDKRIINYINNIAIEENLPIKCEYIDFRKELSKDFKKQFDCFFTDPPYTLEGMNLFLSRGIEALNDESGLFIYLSYAHKSPDFELDMQKNFLKMGLVVSEIITRFNTYEGAEIIGNIGQMIILKTTNNSKALVGNSYEGAIYTGELRATARLYKCKKCGEMLKVGSLEKFRTIEELKLKRCSKCNSQVFELIDKRSI